MSSCANIRLEHSGGGDAAPPELNPKQEYVYGQDFHTTWSILDYIAELNGWQPLSNFCVSEDDEGNLGEEWYDPNVGLETVSGLLNKCFSLMGQGAVVFLANSSEEYRKYYPEPDSAKLPKDEAFLRRALRGDPSFSSALWDLRAYELILRRAVDSGERFHIYVG
ncbi:hypothetical protein [Vacuolonema iberomarrocanum]|uniref:hypothetical protein n=1 Tax=Vacuolonema iberomarrocanum TaxID=3454632 RepID=UPI0019DE24D1|nr:hypothetical protein [filamentous cyanobacterium LEGE 07170]